MSSLNTQHGRITGGMSFDDRSFNADENTREETPLIDSQEKPYRPIRTTGFIVLHILLTIGFLPGIVLSSYFLNDRPADPCEKGGRAVNQNGYHTALYIHAGAFIISLGFDRLYHHYQDLSRRDGYLEFYRRTRNLRRTPLFIISLGNAILVALIEVLENPETLRCPFVEPWHYLAMLTGVEVLIISIALIWYLVRTIKFNKQHARPDATQDDLLSTFVTTETSANEIGYRDETYKENVLEKQADLIRYLRERNEHLGRLVFQYKQEVDFQRGISNNNL